ncbi:MAG: tetratricopeptide repeat protein [Elusimicrobiota bacterium]
MKKNGLNKKHSPAVPPKELIKNWHAFAAVVLTGFLVYFQTLRFGYTYWDDTALILDNYGFIGHMSNILNAFNQEVFAALHSPSTYYRPLLTVSLMLDAQLGGKLPLVYHCTNLFLHLSASCLLFVFLTKLKYKRKTALMAALVFVAHPVLTQAVAWIPGRNDSLLAVFVLAAFINFLSYYETKRTRYYFAHLLFFALALFTKESSLSLVLAASLYLHAVAGEKSLFKQEQYLAYGWLGTGLAWFLLRKHALVNPLHIPLAETLRSFAENLPAVIQFAGKTLLPLNLAVMPTMHDTSFLYGGLSILAAGVLLFVSKNKRTSFVLFGGAWFLLFLLPSLLRPYPEMNADFCEHRLYLPIVGVIILLLETDAAKFIAGSDRRLFSSGLLLTAVFGALAFSHSKNFRDRLSFVQNAVKNSPSLYTAHTNLGTLYLDNGEIDKAHQEYLKAVELNPRDALALSNLGATYRSKNMFKEAEPYYKKSLALYPGNHLAHHGLALICAGTGRFEEAKEEYLKAIELAPLAPKAHNNLGQLYMGKEMYKEAEPEFIKELEVNPDFDIATFNLGLLYFKTGKLKEAEARFKELLRINPGYTGGYYLLENIYYKQGDLKQAAYYAGLLRALRSPDRTDKR